MKGSLSNCQKCLLTVEAGIKPRSVCSRGHKSGLYGVVSGKRDSHSPHPAAERRQMAISFLPLHRWEGTRRLTLRMATQISRLSSVLPRWPPPGRHTQKTDTKADINQRKRQSNRNPHKAHKSQKNNKMIVTEISLY